MKLPLIFFTLLFFLIVFLRWRASKPKEEKATQRESEEKKKGEEKPKAKNILGKAIATAIALFVFVILMVTGYNLAILVANYLHPKAPSLPATQNWQLCWEKKPEHEGKTSTRNHCVSGKIEKKNNTHLVFAYNGNFGKGVLEGTSIDGVSYSGEWKDPTGWGKTHIRFSSSDTAFGWWDDKGKGEKIPTVLEKI